jgi:hypothetical protein
VEHAYGGRKSKMLLRLWDTEVVLKEAHVREDKVEKKKMREERKAELEDLKEQVERMKVDIRKQKEERREQD